MRITLFLLPIVFASMLPRFFGDEKCKMYHYRKTLGWGWTKCQEAHCRSIGCECRPQRGSSICYMFPTTYESPCYSKACSECKCYSKSQYDALHNPELETEHRQQAYKYFQLPQMGMKTYL